ncbi:MAG: uroporphyrinogen decarboxylase family protein, partial [Acidobacteria bacterium]|nr:uroporphyrinogen decarboxylase family protein [Acidobacteriota bacterium]
MTGRERVLGMIEGRQIDRLPLMPITMMFAADLAGVRYGEYARDHRVLVEAQIRTAEEFDFDYVSAISDPGREAADFGAAIEWYENQPPALAEHDSLLGDKAGLGTLKQPDPLGGGRMHDRVKAIELFRRRVAGSKLIEGWVEGPCAEAADLRGINRLMLDFYDDPQFIRALFDAVVDNGMRFAGAQIQAGADIIGVGDAAASLVGPRFYDEFVWPAEKRLVDGIHAAGGRVRLHICGNTRKILAGMGTLGCQIVDLDFLSPLSEGRAQMGPEQVLLGNIDPVKVLRDGSPETVAGAVAECHRQAGPKFIVGAGCEVVRDTPHANLRALCQ